MSMTKSEALQKIEELRLYVQNLEDKEIKASDIVAFSIFKTDSNSKLMLLPIYSDGYEKKFIISGLLDDFSRPYSDEPRTVKEIVSHFNKYGYTRTNQCYGLTTK